SLDSAFCRKCGATLSPDDVQQAREKLEAAVQDGFKIFSTGRTAEAMQIAETAVLANPSSTSALSLKAMCHERLGQISEALDCHERVLAIDPDSMIDKIKANDLRNLLVARSSIAAIPDRRLAIVGAAAAFVLILSIGVVVAKGHANTPERVAYNQPAASLQPKGATFQPVDSTPTQTQTPQAPVTNAQKAANDTGTSQAPVNRGRDDENPDTLTSGGRLPGPLDGPVTINPIFPQQPNPTNPSPRNVATNTPPNGTDPSPKPIDPPAQNGGDQTPPASDQSPGIMDIQVVSGKPGAKGLGSGAAGHPNGVEALLRTAGAEFQTRDYASAATSYERALRAGANPGTANQRLAECYEQLGRNADAVAAYNRAISALQADLDSGRGDKTRTSSALDVCKQAVKVLGG
ncbi:MAG TPA: tetratricopeptide repeat protein, partial [Fimbriimonadaceae bacterium]|nr:tetratricopeptide repeat protein [Fimbriimonadaceae bacterium]